MEAPYMDDAKQAEVRANFDAFQGKLPELLKTHAGKFVVLRNREIVDVFDTFADAAKFGTKMYADDMFSVQEVTERHIELGFFSVGIDNVTV